MGVVVEKQSPRATRKYNWGKARPCGATRTRTIERCNKSPPEPPAAWQRHACFSSPPPLRPDGLAAQQWMPMLCLDWRPHLPISVSTEFPKREMIRGVGEPTKLLIAVENSGSLHVRNQHGELLLLDLTRPARAAPAGRRI